MDKTPGCAVGCGAAAPSCCVVSQSGDGVAALQTVLRLSIRRARRKPAIVILDHLAIAIRSLAVAERPGAVVPEARLEPPREFDLQLAQRVDHFALEQRKLRRIGESVRVDASQLIDCAIQIASQIAISAQCTLQFFGVGQPLAKLAFELALSAARWPSTH